MSNRFRLGFIIAVSLALSPLAVAQSEPQPRVVDPGPPPSDAVILFNGANLDAWETRDGKPAGCTIEKRAMACKTGAGDIQTKAKLGSAQIHLEFLIPSMPDQKSQMRGNSGVYLQGRYEIQVLDSYQNPTYPTGALGALYGQSAPLVNAARRPETWQTYDIIFHAPHCGPDGNLSAPGSVTVLLNGVLVQDHNIITEKANQREQKGCVDGKIGEPGPLLLQDHNFKGAPFTVMRFRNIWYRPLD